MSASPFDMLIFAAYPLRDAVFARALARPEPFDHWLLVVVLALASAILLLKLGSAVRRHNWKDTLRDRRRETRPRARQLEGRFDVSGRSHAGVDAVRRTSDSATGKGGSDLDERLRIVQADALQALLFVHRILESTRTGGVKMDSGLSDPALTSRIGEAAWPIDAQTEGSGVGLESPSAVDEPVREHLFGDITVQAGREIEGDTSRPLVLIVNDNDEVQLLVRNRLLSTYRIAQAHDGAYGLRMARMLQPELIISAVAMRGIEGIEFSCRIKREADLQHVPVVVLTALDSAESRLKGIQAGIDAYMTTPFDADELVAVVDNLIESRRTLRRIYRQQVLLKPYDVVVSSSDCSFVERVYDVINLHLGDAGFTVGRLAREVGVSESHLKRKLRALIDEAPLELIRRIRLERAADLLRQGSGNVGDAAYATGFSNLSYFAKCFRKRWGLTPSQFLAGAASRQSDGRATA